MAVLCSQCGSLIPRPDLSRTPLVCARCAAAHGARDDEDMLTVDAPPPERGSDAPPPERGSDAPPVRPSLRPSIPPPSVRPPPGPTSVARPSVRPPVGGPPGSRIPAGGSRAPRATPSVAPRPAPSVPKVPSAPKIPTVPATPKVPTTPSRAAKPSAPTPPAPRPSPKAEPVAPRAGHADFDETVELSSVETGDFEVVQAHRHTMKAGRPQPPPAMPEWDPDDEPTSDIVLETGDFESIDPGVPRPRR